MTGFKEYDKYDAMGLADLVGKKKVKPSELCEEAISRIEKHNPSLNAVIYKMYDSAREAVKGKLPKGPFTGVPFLVKDALHRVAGVPYTVGSRSLKDYIPDRDSETVTRYRNAGLVILGKTNVPELTLTGFTEPELYGPCRNPWDIERTSGGSSGGSASAVAAGIVPAASGNDGGGSIRIPATFCGLFGMKPTRGRTPMGPFAGEVWQGAACEGVLTRSVRDSAALLDLLSAPDHGAPYIIPSPELPYIKEVQKKPGKLKIAFSTTTIYNSEVDPECVKAVEESVKLCRKLGHTVTEDAPELDGPSIAFSYMMLYMGDVAADIDMIEKLTGEKRKMKNYEPLTWFLGHLGRTYSAGEFVSARRTWNNVGRSFSDFFRKYDLYLTPVTATPAFKVGELKFKTAEHILMTIVNYLKLGSLIKASGAITRLAEANMVKFPFTQIANMAGLPAMSVPLHWTEIGLPVGTQFIGRFGDEATLFRLAAQLEKEKPWFDKRPVLYPRLP